MARSTTADYVVTASAIVEAALEELGVLTPGGTIVTAHQTKGLEKLNLIIKNIMGGSNSLFRGMKLWQRASSTLTLTAKNTFTIYSSVSADLNIIAPVDIYTAVLRNTSSDDTGLTRMTREEYDLIGNKTDTGDPTQYLYERLYEYGKLYLNVVPSDLTKTIVLTYHRPLYDVDAIGDDVDFPQEWLLPLTYALAAHMAPTFGLDDRVPIFQALYRDTLENAATFYPEVSTGYFQPDMDY